MIISFRTGVSRENRVRIRVSSLVPQLSLVRIIGLFEPLMNSDEERRAAILYGFC
jgi:hypothetical protein